MRFNFQCGLNKNVESSLSKNFACIQVVFTATTQLVKIEKYIFVCVCVYKHIYKIKPTVPAAELLAMWNSVQIEATLFNISSTFGCKRINCINVLRRYPPNTAVSSSKSMISELK